MSEALLLTNIGLLQTPVGSYKHGGSKQGENLKLKNASILIKDGKIAEIYADGKGVDQPEARRINAGGRLATPGLIDSHTHLVFGGWRENEIPLKLSGASYLDILTAGGGIYSTVRKTREAGFDELYHKSEALLKEMTAQGVTACEIKSGYGLDLETEIKQLRVIKTLSKNTPMDIVATYLGAHAVPESFKNRPDDYLDFIEEEVLPLIQSEQLAQYCDVFCEKAVFTAEQSEKILRAARRFGLKCKIHTDEIECIGGTKVAAKLACETAEHLIVTQADGIEDLKRGGTIAVLLPQTSLYLNAQYARAREMIDHGVPVAVASDFNPGSCPSSNLHLSMNLSYIAYRLKPEEILSAVTINAAAAIGREKELGSIEVGKQADIVLWDAHNFDYVVYRLGANLCHSVIKSGKVVYEKEDL
ncbi:MAG: imidazolonepropionase [Tissierellia bacterium]|nr:imidazolonepropionase [Bacillota bacterium]NLL22492.1 imidazolonepropionase [Tissierellia bacterium]